MDHGWWRAWSRWWPGGCAFERRALETIVMPLAGAQGGVPVEFWPLHGRPLLWHGLREAGEAGGGGSSSSQTKACFGGERCCAS